MFKFKFRRNQNKINHNQFIKINLNRNKRTLLYHQILILELEVFRAISFWKIRLSISYRACIPNKIQLFNQFPIHINKYLLQKQILKFLKKSNKSQRSINKPLKSKKSKKQSKKQQEINKD